MSDTSKDHKSPKDGTVNSEKPAVTLPGTVEKIIPPLTSNDPEKAQIAVEGAEDLYREIRVENTFQDAAGNDVQLKLGAQVEVTIEADKADTIPKKPDHKKPNQSAAGT
jgi:hypothetical protein